MLLPNNGILCNEAESDDGTGAQSGFNGTPPVEDIDDTTGDVENEQPSEFEEFAAELDADDNAEEVEITEQEEEPAATVQEPAEEPEPTPVEETAEGDDDAQSDEPETEQEKKDDDEPETAEQEQGSKKDGEQEPEPEPTPEKTPEEIKQEWLDQRTAARKNIIDNLQFTEEQVEQLRTEPEVVLKELAADLFLDIHQSVMLQVQQTMPQMMQTYTTQQAAVEKSANDFYAAWDKLDRNDATHTDVLNRIGTNYRQLNPTAPQEQFIREVGAQAMIALGIPLTAEMGFVDAPADPTPSPHKPAAPVQSASKTPVKKNDFEQLADELLEDDDL